MNSAVAHSLETISDGYMEVETFSPGIRDSFEKIRCSSFTGVSEYLAECGRVLELRKHSYEWSPVVIRLVFGDFEHMRSEI